MFKSLPKHMLCLRQKNLLDETVLFSTKIMLELIIYREYYTKLFLN